MNFDEYTQSQDYKPESEVIPWIQALNKAESIEQSGFFLSTENAEKVGFTPDENWEPYTAKFGGGTTVKGLRTITPSFSIIHTSPLFMRLRDRDEDQTLIPFDRKIYNSKRWVCLTRYLLIFFGKNNLPLHYLPIQFTAKGSLCGSFGGELRQIHEEINKIVGRQMGPKFFALWRVALGLDTVLKGEKTASAWVTTVAAHEVADAKKHFLGQNADVKVMLEALFEDYKNFGQLKKTEEPTPTDEFADMPF